jgi:hypothetical protein
MPSKKMSKAHKRQDATIDESTMMGADQMSYLRAASALEGDNYPTQEPHSGPSRHGYKYRQDEAKRFLEEQSSLSGDNYPTQEPHSGPSRHGYKYRQDQAGEVLSAVVGVAIEGDTAILGANELGQNTPIADFHTEGDKEHLALTLPSRKPKCYVVIKVACDRAKIAELIGTKIGFGLGSITKLAKIAARNKLVKAATSAAVAVSPIGPQLEMAHSMVKLAKGGNPQAQKKLDTIKAKAAKGDKVAQTDAAAIVAAEELHEKTEAIHEKNREEVGLSRYKHGVRAGWPVGE